MALLVFLPVLFFILTLPLVLPCVFLPDKDGELSNILICVNIATLPAPALLWKMATSQAFLTVPVPAPSSYIEFKLNIQNKLLWNRSDWVSANLLGSQLFYFCKNLHYWFNKLAEVVEPHYLVFTTFSAGSHFRPSFAKILAEYKKQFTLSGLIGASQSINSKYIVFHFDSLELRERVVNNFCFVDHSFIVHSDWLSHTQNIHFQLNGFPPDLSVERIQWVLQKYAPVTTIRKEVLDLGDGDLLSTGKVLGTLDVSALSRLDSLPYFINIHPYNAHWIIYRRKPICFSCREVGHFAVNCPLTFCVTCCSRLPRIHQCLSVTNGLPCDVPPLSDVSSNQNVRLWQSPKSDVVTPSRPFSQLSPNKIQRSVLHKSWNNETPTVLSAGFVNLDISENENYFFGPTPVASPSALDAHAALLTSTLDSFRQMQEDTDKTLTTLKALPLGVRLETPLVVKRHSLLPSQLKAAKGQLDSVTDPPLTVPKGSGTKHPKAKK